MKADNKYLPIFYLTWIMVVFFFNMPMPYDDLLRDVVAGNYQYDYSKLYIFAPYLAKYNQYILFDLVLFKMSTIFGNSFTVHLVQVFAYIVFMIPTYLIINRILRDNVHRNLFTTAILIVIFNDYTMLRLVLARPEMFFTCWLTWGIYVKLMDQYKYKILWFFVGVVMIPSYWLSFFYVPIIFIVFNTKLQKLVFTTCFILICALFWQLYSVNLWLPSILELGKLNHNRIASIGENRSILTLLLTPEVMIAVFMYGYSYKDLILYKLHKYRNIKSILDQISKISYNDIVDFIFSNNIIHLIILLVIPFCLLNMIRYSVIFSVVLGVLLALRINEVQIKLSGFTKYILLCLVIFIPLSVKCYRTIPEFKFPEHSSVLATSLSNYYVPFFNKTVRVAPAMEVGANESGIQQLMKSIDIDGTVSCSELKRYHFDYLVEKNLSSIPGCLSIYEVQPGWRSWRVIYE